MPEYEVAARVTPALSVQETAKLFAGLSRLRRSGQISFRLEPVTGADEHPRVVRLSAGRGAEVREIAIDLSDQHHLFHLADLEDVDLYLKRSFREEAVDALPAPLGAKVRPFGLNHPTIDLHTSGRLLLARARTGRSLKDLRLDARQLLALPPPRAFERSPGLAAEPLVLFQTRVWEPRGDPLTERINEERAELVRALRSAFGPRVVGGIVPSGFARQRYRDVLTTQPVSMRAYPQLVRRALVGISTRGLHDSIGFKLAEYLAASCCVVGHEPNAVLPEPLVAGRHYLPFRTADECVAGCEKLLSDPRAAAEMRRRNSVYYLAQAEPAAQMLSALELAFQSSSRK